MLHLVTRVMLTAEQLAQGPQLPIHLPNDPNLTPIPALVDTGAAMSIIDVDLANRFFASTPHSVPIGGLGQGDEYPTFEIDVHIPDLGRQAPKPVASGPLIRSGLPFTFVIGRDILLDYILTIDGYDRTISFHQR